MFACRPSTTQRAVAGLDMDEDNEDAPAIVDDLDAGDEENADLQHGSLRAEFPMAFGMPSTVKHL
jgi:hypothetical protein